MYHGSILGNGAYFGVDYTADALELKVEYMRGFYPQERHDAAYVALSPAERAAVDRLVELDLEAGTAALGVEPREKRVIRRPGPRRRSRVAARPRRRSRRSLRAGPPGSARDRRS